MHQLYYEALLSHPLLSETDRKWLTANFNLSFNKARDVLLAYRMSVTGRIAIRYNRSLDRIAKSRNIKQLGDLYKMTFAEAVPELDMLNKAERAEVMKRINLEYSAVKNLKVDKHHRGNLIPHKYEEVGRTPYCQSFKLLCFEEADMNYIPSIISNKINIKDDSIYCFDKDEIVARFSKGNYINPITNEPFSKYAIGLLMVALAIDLKIVDNE
jgi:hypothetical protein